MDNSLRAQGQRVGVGFSGRAWVISRSHEYNRNDAGMIAVPSILPGTSVPGFHMPSFCMPPLRGWKPLGSARSEASYSSDFGSDLFLGDFDCSSETNWRAEAGTPTLCSTMISLALSFLP